MRILTLAVAAMLAISGVAQAGVVIDTFTEPDDGVQSGRVEVNGVGDVAHSELPGGGDPAFTEVIGGYRQVDLIQTEQGSGGGSASFQFSPTFSYANEPGSASVGVITWDGEGGMVAFNADGSIDNMSSTAGAGLGGIDLTEGGNADGTGGASTQFLIDLVSIDLTVSVLVQIIDMNGDISLTDKGMLTVGTNAKFLSTFDNVGAGAGQVDLTNVNSIRLIIEGPSDTDAIIDFVGTGVVPEPASMALMGLGSLLVGCGVARRRRKQASELVS